MVLRRFFNVQLFLVIKIKDTFAALKKNFSNGRL